MAFTSANAIFTIGTMITTTITTTIISGFELLDVSLSKLEFNSIAKLGNSKYETSDPSLLTIQKICHFAFMLVNLYNKE
ncbi:10223_t:CDS:2 [Cetraspora pellucida]|uniref:10223_t:CDS:1 n=1 Tax=Cetraspora pellucida TaxID=1433469 RepID=A0A9N9DB37_9GLOM|nr:10223_t:CDS:2 [Cetraspora pellucida]